MGMKTELTMGMKAELSMGMKTELGGDWEATCRVKTLVSLHVAKLARSGRARCPSRHTTLWLALLLTLAVIGSTAYGSSSAFASQDSEPHTCRRAERLSEVRHDFVMCLAGATLSL
eukprot:1120166-Rhodomonas_salina.7